jgi:hypothetical protein
MEEVTLELDMYDLFDRIGEGVMFKYKVKYDWQSIVKDDVNDQNFIVEAVGFADDDQRYLQSYRMSVEEWTNDAMQYITRGSMQTAQEAFFESLPDATYNEYSDARGW